MHRGPWEQAGGSRPAQHSPARAHTRAHARSQTPGCDSAPGQQQRPAPAATHAGQRERGRRVPLSPTFPSSRFAPSPPLRSLRLAGSYPRLRQSRALLRLPPPGLAFGGCRSPWPSAGALQLFLPRARGSGRGRCRHGWYSYRGAPTEPGYARPLPPTAASGWARPPPPAPAAIALAPGSARPCPGSPKRPTALGFARPQGGGCRKGILTYTHREDSTAGEDCWTQRDPPTSERDTQRWHSYHREYG